MFALFVLFFPSLATSQLAVAVLSHLCARATTSYKFCADLSQSIPTGQRTITCVNNDNENAYVILASNFPSFFFPSYVQGKVPSATAHMLRACFRPAPWSHRLSVSASKQTHRLQATLNLTCERKIIWLRQLKMARLHQRRKLLKLQPQLLAKMQQMKMQA